MSALQVEQLVVRRGKQEIVHGVDLAVQPGEIVAVLGPNGAGKSTFLAAVGGLLPKRSGRIERNGRVATVLQTPALAARTARANVELALAWSGSPRGGRRSRAMDALTRMRADHLARRPARSLSGGEQRRVHLARAVAVAPDLMLLDEPFDGLDPQSHVDLRDDTVEVLRAGGSAVVAVLHERADAWAMADRLAILIDGRLEALGSPAELLDRPPTIEVARFLGYDGELRRSDGVLLTRPRHVQVDPLGKLAATVGRVVVTEDGLRVQLQTSEGVLWSAHPARDMRRGDEVHVTVTGGAHFPAG